MGYQLKFLGCEVVFFFSFLAIFYAELEKHFHKAFSCDSPHHGGLDILTFYMISDATCQGEHMLPKTCYVDISV